MRMPQIESTNEFILACSEVEIPVLLTILKNLMDELKFLHPEKYQVVLSQLRQENRTELTRKVDTKC